MNPNEMPQLQPDAVTGVEKQPSLAERFSTDANLKGDLKHLATYFLPKMDTQYPLTTERVLEIVGNATAEEQAKLEELFGRYHSVRASSGSTEVLSVAEEIVRELDGIALRT